MLYDSPGYPRAASGESTASVLLWKTPFKTNWREGFPVAHLNFFGTAFDPRVWTMVVFWKEDSAPADYT